MKRPWKYRRNFLVNWRCLFLMVSMVLGSAKAGLPAPATSDELYEYREVTGKISKEMAWHLTREDDGSGYRLDCISPAERHVTVTDGDYNTVRWEMKSADGETQLVAERKDRTIVIRGRFNGESIDEVLKVDDCPWYQATSLSLRGFIDSGESECVFWTIRLKTLTAHKVKATKKGLEKIEANEDQLIRIRLALPGLLAPFWKSDYWFDSPGGVFFRFQGPSGPPGSPVTTITRIVD